MFGKISTVHFAVKNVDEAAKLYQETFGFKVTKSGNRPQSGIKNAYLKIGDAQIELVEPLEPGKGPVARFLQERGEGLYMIAFEVENMDSAIKSLKAKGVRLLGADPESRAKGASVFVHPQSTTGVLMELVQKK